MFCRLPLLLFLLLLSALPSAAFAAPLTRGDYDNDGVQDLAVALVNRSGTTGNTPYLARGSSAGPMFWIFSRPADAFAPGRFFANAGTAPASVLVTSSAEPLLWTVIKPDRTEATVRFGLPGDTITNLIDWDGDKLDDFLVVRPNSQNQLVWFMSLSAYGGGIAQVTFGEKGDRVFTYYHNGVPHLGAVRLGAAGGACAGQFDWYSLNFSLNENERVLGRRCWGLPGDIPIARVDYNGNRRAEWIIVRPGNGVQTAYILNDDESTFQTVALGLDSAIPQVGKFKRGGVSRFAWSQRDQGLVGISNPSAEPDIISFGISTNVIIRPDGTVVQPSSSDKLSSADEPTTGGGGELGCQVEKSFRDGNQGNLWKPVSEGFQGNPVALFPASYNNSQVTVFAADGSVATTVGRTKCCDSNGGRAHFWFNKRASAMTSQAPLTVRVTKPDGVIECFPVENPTSRYD